MIKSLNASGLTQLFLSTIFKLHGLPSSIISDHDPVFTSLFWTKLTLCLSIKLKLPTTYHPQSNGQTECINQCVEQYLRNFCSYQQDDWVNWLGLAEFQYNNKLHSATKNTPFYLTYGLHPWKGEITANSDNPLVEQFITKLSQTRDEAKAALEENNERMALRFTGKRIKERFTCGDQV